MDASGRHGASIFSHKKKAGDDAAAVTPGFRFPTERIGNVDAADLPAFRVEIQISAGQMFHLDLHQFADSGTGGDQKTDDEIPEIVMFRFQIPFKCFTVLVGDDRVLKGFTGCFHGMKAETG